MTETETLLSIHTRFLRGIVRRALTAIAVAIALPLTLLIAAPATQAGQFEFNGITVTWDDAQLHAPAAGECQMLPFTATNTNADSRFVRMRDAAESTEWTSWYSFEEDAHTWEARYCSESAFGDVRPGTTRTIEIQVKKEILESYSTSSFTITFTDRLPAIVLEQRPCHPDDAAEDPAICANPNVLKLPTGENWLYGYTPTFYVVGYRGRISSDTETYRHTDAWPETAEYVRVDPTQFKPGLYIMVANGSKSGSWKCSLSYKDFCRWVGPSGSTYGYYFTWDGANLAVLEGKDFDSPVGIVALRTCEAARAQFPNGVAVSKKVANRLANKGKPRPLVDRFVYQVNKKKFDKNKNGVICEK